MKLTEEEYREQKDLTRTDIELILNQHGVIDKNEFYIEQGHEGPFSGSDVLDWLGY